MKELYDSNAVCIIVSTENGDFYFQSAEEVLEFLRTAAQEHNEIWISGEQKYPCIAVCINGEYAAISYFQSDAGDMWLSYNEENQEEGKNCSFVQACVGFDSRTAAEDVRF